MSLPALQELRWLPIASWHISPVAGQALQRSWRHLTRWLLRVNLSWLQWSATAQSTGMLFSSWVS